jgi:REP element-mobilizing transposase RayT
MGPGGAWSKMGNGNKFCHAHMCICYFIYDWKMEEERGVGMPADNIPEKCKACAKFHASTRYHRYCDTCQGLNLEEGFLCDLNRSVQDAASFICMAFEPKFSVVSSVVKPEMPVERQLNKQAKAQHLNIFNSDKIQYERALALQRLRRDPDTILMQLQYHFAWNVRFRKPLFKSDENLREAANRLFNESSQVVKDFVSLIAFAPDHVHVLVESNGKLSVEKLIRRIKEFTGNGLIRECPALKASFEKGSIWDDAYIAETIG